MPLPTPTMTGQVQVINGDFEAGNTGWSLIGTANIVNEPQIAGNWCVKTQASGETNDGFCVNSTKYPVTPGQSISLNATAQCTTGTPGTGAFVSLEWYAADQSILGYTHGPITNRQAMGSNQFSCAVTGTAPSGAAYVSARGAMNVSASATVSTIYMDNFSWNYVAGANIQLTAPATTQYSSEDQIPYRISYTIAGGQASITSVEYFYMTYDSGLDDYINPTSVAVVTTAPYAHNATPMVAGQYGAYAVVTLSTGLQITTNSRVFTVGTVIPITREYKASNSYTYLVGENILNLGSGLPSTAVVTGVEVEMTYELEARVRAKDKDVTDISQFTPSVVFDVVNSGVFETALMSKANGQYTVLGSPSNISVPIEQADFVVSEQGVADGQYLWTVYTGGGGTVTVGGETELFNIGSAPASDFLDYAVGVRFYPTVTAKPDYAADGDACVRVRINTLKIRVFFDAGSVEYYFASADKTQVLKGTLVAYNVLDGDFKNGDATGVMQLSPVLEQIDGTQTWIGDDWTIHSGYPVTDRNQIGTVDNRPRADGVGMEYNALPGQDTIFFNRSRYVFDTYNFYGDTNLESIYGVNGADRAFAYNGDDFYKIFTQPDATKDRPRHLAFHHSHLALGYLDGRVDISVVGEPYNFSGLDGASSWAIGDPVTGMLALSGAILGVFCRKSVVGISGTTVDNFATQTLSPSLGAVEYTVTDMGFPVYANAYGIYTLAQTQQYGDYLGNPLSQQVSPWLRPRLVRKYTSDREVVVAWPVRSKNQYKLAFSDGYVLSMTMNYGQQSSPTFSKQKYFIHDDEDTPPTNLYLQKAIYPIAVSSELDDTGEERIHVAHRPPDPDVPPILRIDMFNGLLVPGGIVPLPPELTGADFQLVDPENPLRIVDMVWEANAPGEWQRDVLDDYSDGLWLVVQGAFSQLAFVVDNLS